MMPDKDEILNVLKQVESIAALAGLRGAIETEHLRFKMAFDVGNGRSHLVYVRVTGKTIDSKTVVTLFSAARTLTKGMFGGLGREQALELLRLNESTLFARFGIWDGPKEMMIVASLDALIDTLDADEMRAYALSVSHAADTYEAKHGGDTF
jgi:hypothetical protein